MASIAYLIMAYKNPDQIKRVINALAGKEIDFYIHIDKKFPIDSFLFLGALKNVFFINNRIKILWGTYSLTRGILASFKEILNLDTEYDYFGIISGQDYPINPVKSLYQFLDDHPKINLISFLDHNDPWYIEAYHRAQNFSCNDLPFIGKYRLEKFLNLYFKKFRFRYPVLYGGPGTTFMILSNDCTRFLLETISKNSKMRFHLNLTWGPDEFIFQTIIMNSSFKNSVCANTLYYMDWKSGGLHPKTFTSLDFADLASQPQYLARKFDSTLDGEILDLLDFKLNN